MAIEIFPIHFDVPGHEIPLATFISAATNTERVIHGLNAELFDGRVEFELFVLPPQEGTFLQRLEVRLLAGWAAIWAFTASDIGKGYIKGLTGHEPAYWSEVAGEATAHLAEAVAHPHQHEKKVGTVIVTEAAKSFLEKESSELQRVGITPAKFREAYAAKNAFYEACDATPRLRAIGFSEAPIFPIQKQDFLRLQTELPPELEDAQPPWHVATAKLHVTSPNWDRDDRQRAWKGRDQQGRNRHFRIEDEEFWNRVAAGAIKTHVIDSMTVQWAFQGKPESPNNCRVLRVLEFNGERLAKPLTDDELIGALGKLAQPEVNGQRGLFDDWSEPLA